jgi:hypothetical protein
MAHKQLFGLFAGKTLRTVGFAMSEDHGINSFAAAYTTPIA